MKRKSKAYITIYALYMIFVLMIVIVFVLVQVKNIRTVNAYKYDYIQAKAIAYSKVRIINQRKLFDEELKKNSKSDTFYIQITDIPELSSPTKIDYYEEKEGAAKIFSFTSSYPDNNGSRVTTRMVYNRKNPFEKRIISEEKIDELLQEITEGKKSIGIKHCFIFSHDNKTYYIDKNIVDEKFKKFVQEKSQQKDTENSDDNKIEIDEEFLTKLVEFSTTEKNVLVDSEEITIFNDVTIDGVFIDKNNVYFVENENTNKLPQITVNGVLVLKNPSTMNYTVKGEYLSTKDVDIKFTRDTTVYKSKKYEFAGSYYK